MGKLRTLLQEAAGAMTDIKDLRPGDVFVLPNNTGEYAIQKLYDSRQDPDGRWGIMSIRGEEHIIFSNASDDRITELVPGVLSSLSFSVTDRKSKTKKLSNCVVRFSYDVSPNADAINDLLRSKALAPMAYNYVCPYGITAVQVIDVDERFVVTQRTAAKGLKKADLILQVLHDAGEPMSREDILQRVARLEGKPFVPTSNVSYFAKSNPSSMVSKGMLEPVKVGNRVLYQPTVRLSDIDWREQETTPEDYYAV